MLKEHIISDIYNRMKSYHIPGLSVGIIEHYNIKCIKNFGRISSNLPDYINDNTLFQFGSISKPIVAFATLRLVEMKILDLDTNIDHYLTSWKIPSNMTWKPKLTIRQLLSHTAGVSVNGFNGYCNRDSVPTLLDILNNKSNSGNIKVNDIPGLNFNYSGGGYCILQQLLMDVTKQNFSELINELVFKPLNMTNSIFCAKLPHDNNLSFARGHYFDGIPINNDYIIYPELAASGLWSTVSDISNFTIEVEKSFMGLSKGILKRALVNEFLTPQLNSCMGLGIFVHNRNATMHFSHGGTTHGYQSTLVGYPSNGSGLIAVANSNNASNIFSYLINKLLSNTSENKISNGSQNTKINYDRYIGDYVLENNIPCSIRKEHKKIVLKIYNQNPINLEFEKENVFSFKEYNYKIIFIEENGMSEFILMNNKVKLKATSAKQQL